MNPIVRRQLIILGSGLSGVLAAYRLKQAQPQVDILLIDRAQEPCGQHTWSFHESDIRATWFRDFFTYSWTSHEVRFPKHHRLLKGGYKSLQSPTLRSLTSSAFDFLGGSEVLSATEHEVTLADGTKLQADVILDARGWNQQIPVAYQKFLGLELQLHEPHRYTRPILMDATVPQIDGYRFMYTLPFAEDRILLEDTYYSSRPNILSEQLESRILSYSPELKISRIVRKETGCLPLPLSGNLKIQSEGPTPIGLRAGLFHATTGYSLPFAVQTADLIASTWKLGHRALRTSLQEWSREHWDRQGYYRLLNRMLFLASTPNERYRVLEKFYRTPESTIARFYSGESTFTDKLRILSGRPPVPVGRALKVSVSSGGHLWR